MARHSSYRACCVAGVAALLLALGSRPAAAQCSVSNNTGEHLYVSDALGGCKRFDLSGGLPTAKPRIRRGGVTHFLLVRQFADQYKDAFQASQGTINNRLKGIDGDEVPPIGWVSWDLTLADAAQLGDMRIDFGPVGLAFGPFTLTVAVDRRGEITAIQQTPLPGNWGSDVSVTVTGRDIGNATLEIAGHSVSGINSGNTSLTFATRATSTSSRTSVDMAIWDKANSKSLGLYVFPGKAFSGQLTYAAVSSPPPCTSVPSLGAPTLEAPASGAVIGGFASPTDPVKADVSLSWRKVPDPQQSYLLHVETYAATTTLTAPTGGKQTNTVTLSPLGTTEQTVIVPTSQGSLPSLTLARSLTRSRVYKWKVRATNCGQSAAWSSLSTFTVQ